MNTPATGWPSAANTANDGWGPVPTNLLPKRIEGWPAGTQRAANDAERLLSTAVGWWDAAWYNGGSKPITANATRPDADRFLRNRGVAGELLDMRLGSSLAPNSNDPLWLGPEVNGYVYIPTTGNSVSCTAPASATQYVAYEINGTTSSGAATGGAAFTFSTVGQWRRVELQDVTNTVVAAFDGDLLTDGSNTTQTDSYAVAWAINRATSGRKTVAMPAKGRGGRALFLFGGDDYSEVPTSNAFQHQMLNFKQGENFTVLAALRQWANGNNNTAIMNKGSDFTNGFALYATSNTPVRWQTTTADGTNSASVTNTSVPLGTASTLAMTVNGGARLLTQYTNAATIGTASIANVKSHELLNPLRIGTRSQIASVYIDMEFTAAAIFRRALTAAEITLLNTYFQNRGF